VCRAVRASHGWRVQFACRNLAQQELAGANLRICDGPNTRQPVNVCMTCCVCSWLCHWGSSWFHALITCWMACMGVQGGQGLSWVARAVCLPGRGNGHAACSPTVALMLNLCMCACSQHVSLCSVSVLAWLQAASTRWCAERSGPSHGSSAQSACCGLVQVQ
jgi:hypothetical protein